MHLDSIGLGGLIQMKVYRCLVKNGHCGSGKYTERTVFIWASSTLDAMSKAKRLGGVKKGRLLRSGGSVLSVERASGWFAGRANSTDLRTAFER